LAHCDEASRSKATIVSIVCDPADPIACALAARWAGGELEKSLAARGIAVRRSERLHPGTHDDCSIVAAGHTSPIAREILFERGISVPDAPESLGLAPAHAGPRPVLLACGSDVRGLAYALLELADRITCSDHPAAALHLDRPIVERPANAVRSVSRAFVSEMEDKPWFYDRSFWNRYLSMLAAQRFNRFALTLGLGYDSPHGLRDSYFYFAYPFLVSVPGYNVQAAGLPDSERDQNLETLRWISQEAAIRGLHFQLGLWAHAYECFDSPEVNYTIQGLTAERHAAYCRDALQTLLEACPAISGVTFRIHGESGVPEGNYEFWRTVFDGIARCGRRVEIDMHAKGIDEGMIEVALATGMPVNISPKFSAEHMGLPYHQAWIRALELPQSGAEPHGFYRTSSGARRFLRYGYGDLLSENRRYGVIFRMWPGTQRLLLWGDPAIAAGYGRASSFCGSLGAEICEPLFLKGRRGSGVPGGREVYGDSALRPEGGDWEKYLYAYRLWGRLLYNPDSDPETWRRFLRRQFENAAECAEMALAHASRILPLVSTAHCPSASVSTYWPELYTNMPIVDSERRHPYGDSPSPKRFGTVSPLDPILFSRVDDFAAELIEGQPSAKYSPVEVARKLQALAETAARCLAEASARVADAAVPEFRRFAVDVAIQSQMGAFFAWKLRAGVLYALYERSGRRSALEEALKSYRAARDAWSELIARAGGCYAQDLTFGIEPQLRGHWVDRLPAIDQDIADMEDRLESANLLRANAPGEDAITRALRMVLNPPRRPRTPCDHTPPAPFRPGQTVIIEIAVREIEGQALPLSVLLRYRHVNQAECYREAIMEAEGSLYRAEIPRDYTNSPFPLQYFFEMQDALGRAWLYPGFADDLSSQPYYVLRQTRLAPQG